MPIIPRVDVSGDIPVRTPEFSTPPQDPALLAQASNANKIGAIAGEFESVMSRKAHLQGYYDAQNLKDEYALRTDANVKAVLSSAPHMRDGALEGGISDPGGLSEPGVTTSIVPKSQTMQADYDALQGKLDAEFAKRTQGVNMGWTQKYFAGPQSVMKKNYGIRMQSLVHAQANQEIGASVLDGIDQDLKQLDNVASATPPQAVTDGATGDTILDPTMDTAYQNRRKLIGDRLQDATDRGVFTAEQAQKLNLHYTAKMDINRAKQVAAQDPDGWNAAIASGKNGYLDRLSETQQLQIGRQVSTALTKRDGTAAQQKKDLSEATEAGYSERTSTDGWAKNPLDESTIRADWKARKINRDVAEHWLTTVQNLRAGKWESDPDTLIQQDNASQRPDVDADQISRQNELLVNGRKLSIADRDRINGVARGIQSNRENKDNQQGTAAYGAVHSSMVTSLTTPASLTGPKFDKASNAVRAQAAQELSDIAIKTHNDPVALHEWATKKLPQYQARIPGMAQDTIQQLSGDLPVRAPQSDPKSGFIEADEFARTSKDLFRHYKVDPKNALQLRQQGTFPADLDANLKALDWIYELDKLSRKGKDNGR